MEKIQIITRSEDLEKIGAKTFKDYITPIVKEKASLTIQKPPTLAHEKAWLKTRARQIKDKKCLMVVLFIDNKLSGCAEARVPETDGESKNVHFGLSISKEYRGRGFGEKLLKIEIKESKKGFKPKNLWIEHVQNNIPARKLYQKLGFVEIARLKDYHCHYGKYKDKILMRYKRK